MSVRIDVNLMQLENYQMHAWETENKKRNFELKDDETEETEEEH